MSTIKVTNLRHESATSNNISLDSSARVGIGEASPNRQLVVNGGTSEGVIQITNDTSGTAVANGFELIHFTNGETQLLNRENGAMRFDTNGSERMRILAGGGLTFNGDTATANALDDYEEGSWTPAISGATLSGASGNYTRIGRFVHAFFYCPVSSHNNDTTEVEITGLPFTAIERSPGVSLIVRNGIDHTIQLLGTHGAGSFSSIKFAKTVNDGNSDPLRLNDCNTSWHLGGVMTYHAQ